MWKELIEALNELNKIYGAARELAERKRGALVAADMDAIAKITEEEKEIALRVQTAETRRKRILVELAAALPYAHSEMKISDLIRFAPTKDYALVLSKLHRALETNVKKVRELGENNQVLLEAALTAVNLHLKRLGETAEETTYGGEGRGRGGASPSRLEVDA